MMTLMKMPWKYILICDLEEDNELNVSDSMEERISDDVHEEVTDTEEYKEFLTCAQCEKIFDNLRSLEIHMLGYHTRMGTRRWSFSSCAGN